MLCTQFFCSITCTNVLVLHFIYMLSQPPSPCEYFMKKTLFHAFRFAAGGVVFSRCIFSRGRSERWLLCHVFLLYNYELSLSREGERRRVSRVFFLFFFLHNASPGR